MTMYEMKAMVTREQCALFGPMPTQYDEVDCGKCMLRHICGIFYARMKE